MIRAKSRISQKVGLLGPNGGPGALIESLTDAFHFGESQADIISTVEFDSTGNYLATGDKGGRVVLFERNESVSWPSSSGLMVT